MKVLALEFSVSCRSVAVLDGGDGAEGAILATVSSDAPRAPRPIELVASALARAGLKPHQVERLAVSLGPGSYTGIRSALAIAQGWSLGRAVPVIGISNMEALAWRAQAEGWSGELHFGIDAQREEFYLSCWRVDAGSRQRLGDVRLASRGEVQALARGGTMAGPGLQRLFSEARELVPDAVALANLSFEREAEVPPERLEPIYLRPVAFVKARVHQTQ